MGRFIRQGRVVILTTGRYAGKKAVVVKTFDDGNAERGFPHALVAGIEKAPLFVTRKMHEEKQKRRLRVKPFVKYVNYQHIMPTRYLVSGEIDLKGVVTDERMSKVAERKALKKELRNLLTEKYTSQAQPKKGEKGLTAHTSFFYAKLRF